MFILVLIPLRLWTMSREKGKLVWLHKNEAGRQGVGKVKIPFFFSKEVKEEWRCCTWMRHWRSWDRERETTMTGLPFWLYAELCCKELSFFNKIYYYFSELCILRQLGNVSVASVVLLALGTEKVKSPPPSPLKAKKWKEQERKNTENSWPSFCVVWTGSKKVWKPGRVYVLALFISYVTNNICKFIFIFGSHLCRHRRALY